jgi:DNA-binding CsgD family transcriptional regulator
MVIGRGEELARIEQLLATARLGTSQVLVIAGEPGIGKTALLEYAVEHAREMTVLRARGVESESEIPFAGLHQLLRPALNRIDELPEPQAAALKGALGLAPGTHSDRFLIGVATLSLLTLSAEQRPLLVAVDDAQWVDESSLGAILFAARRVYADALAVLVATRPGDALPQGLDAIVLRGLDRAAAAQVLERQAGKPLPPGVADRVFEATLGNPLALIELAAGEGVETSVEQAFAARIDKLPEPTQRLLALAAAEEAGDLAVLQRTGADLTPLAAAEQGGLVTVALDQLTFCHPLARSAAYRSAPSDERRAAHRVLADAETDPDRRAWHRAAAALGHDAEAAQALEDAGRRALARGAYAATASSLERAAKLTADARDRARRLFDAAGAAWLAGHTERAEQRLTEARALAQDGALRLEIDQLRGHAALRAGRVEAAHDILVAASATAPPDRAVEMLAEAAEACVYAADPQRMLHAAQSAWEQLAPDAGDRARCFANLTLGMALIYNGRHAADHLRTATALLETNPTPDPRLLALAAQGALWLREAERGRALVTRAIESARASAAVGALPFSLWIAGRDAATSDRLAVAIALYEEAIRLARETGQATALCAGLSGLACVEARLGRAEACREHAAEALAETAPLGLAFFRTWAFDALAELELGLGDVQEAVKWLEEKERLLAERGIEDPDSSPVPELVEALVRLDRAAEAEQRLPTFATAAEAKGQPWSLARLARCRGLLGDDEQYAEALKLHQRTPDRFEQARTQLCHGEALRRARQRVKARDQLRAAVEGFDALGAAPWAERARRELQSSGETMRRRDALTLDALTPRELQVALVLAEGHTIRETAAKLFLSPKTVDHHLQHVYRKLAIDSRAALAEALAQDQEPLPMRSPPSARTVTSR